MSTKPTTDYCPWPNCDCPVSFPEGTQVSRATQCLHEAAPIICDCLFCRPLGHDDFFCGFLGPDDIFCDDPSAGVGQDYDDFLPSPDSPRGSS